MRPLQAYLVASLLASIFLTCHSFLSVPAFARNGKVFFSSMPSPRDLRSGPRPLHMEAPEEVNCDVLIVGGGPAGCTAALYTSRAALSTVVLDKTPAVGALAITSHIANYPGIDKSLSGAELLDLMRDQCIQYGTVYKRAQVFIVDTEGEQKVRF